MATKEQGSNPILPPKDLKNYTVEDWYNDHPPGILPKFVFPWEAAYHQQELDKVMAEAEKAKKERKARAEKEIKEAVPKAGKEAKEAVPKAEKGIREAEKQSQINLLEELFQNKIIGEEVYQARVLPLQAELKKIKKD